MYSSSIQAILQMYSTILFWYVSSTETLVLALLPFVKISSLNHTCILVILHNFVFLESFALISGEQGYFRQTALQIDSAAKRVDSSLDLLI